MKTLSNNEIKWVNSLGSHKHRLEAGAFVAEGTRCVGELLPLLKCRMLAATDGWIAEHADAIAVVGDVHQATAQQIKRMSQQQSPQQVIAVFDTPQHRLDIEAVTSEELVLALDSVRDPGNMGTIVRLADWFGIKHILCSTDTVDVFNPKVVQATMGAIGRVAVHYIDLAETLKSVKSPVYGTFLDGDNLYDAPLKSPGVIVMGNEANGISADVEAAVTHRLYIPPYPPGAATVESLNVGVATAITVAEFRRQLK